MHRSMAWMMPAALLLGLAVSPAASDKDTAALGGTGTRSAYVAAESRAPESTPQQKGRYKKQGKQGELCEWDANDTGPNQCTPVTAGRFKKSGDSCTWVANDRGSDQCRPPKGRWTKSGSSCLWRANDSGPDQCNPRQPK